MGSVKTRIIACKTIVNEMLPFLSPDTTYQSVEPGLHLQPEKLQSALQAMVNDVTAYTATIILGYGLCSLGVISLQAACSTLVVPRRADCIAIFLGSQRPYKKELKLEYQEITGTSEFLAKMCNGPWDDEFVVTLPGHTVQLANFMNLQAG